MRLAAGTDREIWTSAQECPVEVRELLIRILTVQVCSDSAALLMGRWILDAPPADQHEEAQAVEQEFRHAAEARQLLLDLGFDPDPLIREAQQSVGARGRKLDLFMEPIIDWLDMNVFKFLGEWGGMLQNLAGIGSRYLPYAIWNARTFQDEGFVHFEAGRKVLDSYANDESHLPRLRTAVAKWYPLCIDMFGSSESANDAKCLAYGIKTLSNRELREAWLDGALPTLLQYGLTPADPLLGKRQRYDEHEVQVEALVARSGTKVSA